MTFLEMWRVFLWFVAGQVLIHWLTRSPEERRLRDIVLVSFWLRLGLGMFLYTISYFHWPILSSLQGGDGFWTFALDARLYHEWGVRIAEAWRQGIELPNPGMSHDYFTLIAVIYWMVAPHPFSAILLHAWLGALTGWLAYQIGQKLFDSKSALRGAFLVSMWPSSILWSSQILRDVVSWCLVLTIAWLIVLILGSDGQPVRQRWWPRMLQASALALSTLLLTRLRVYLGSILALTAIATLASAVLTYLMNRRVGQAMSRFIRAILRPMARAVALGSVTILMVGAVLMGRAMDPLYFVRLISPTHPEQGHMKLALHHQKVGNILLAEAEVRRAIDVRPDYEPAYLLWARLLFEARRTREALQICTHWPGTDANGAMRKLTAQIEEVLSAEQASQAAEASSASTQSLLMTPPVPAAEPSAPSAEPSAIPVLLRQMGRVWGKNKPPHIDAGAPQTISSPRTIVLQGRVRDDKRPFNTLRYLWSQRLGPPARFLDPTVPKATVELLEVGIYRFRLVATDGELSEFDEVVVTVGPPVQQELEMGSPQAISPPPFAALLSAAPSAELPARDDVEEAPPETEPLPLQQSENFLFEVDAGSPSIIPYPQTIVLQGRVRDGTLSPNGLKCFWSQQLGPPVRFTDPATLEASVHLFESGMYRFRLTVSDGVRVVFDDVAITVEGNFVKTIAEKMRTQWPALIYEMSPQWLGSLRGSIVTSGGGNALMDRERNISHPLGLMKYLPRAILIGFFSPFPWQWFDQGGSSGGMRVFAGMEALLIYLLVVGLVLRGWQALRSFGFFGAAQYVIRHMQLAGLFLFVYGLAVAASASLVMANFGTLFRLRLLFWLPLLILMAASDPLGVYPWYRRLVRRFSERRRSSTFPAEFTVQSSATTELSVTTDAWEGRRG